MDNTWLWLVGGLVIALVGASAVLRRVRANNAQLFSQEATAERAAQASARLSEPQHRLVNRHLAMGNLLAAAQEIRQATGQNARGALLDAQAMRLHPQPWKPAGLFDAVEPGQDGTGEGGPTDDTASGSDFLKSDAGPQSAEPNISERQSAEDASEETSETGPTPSDTVESGPARSGSPDVDATHSADPARSTGGSSEASNEHEWTIPDSWEEVYGGDAGRGERHMEFTHHNGEDLRRFSTQDLPDSERDQLMSQLRDGDMASAADLIASRVGLDRDEVENALRSNHESGNDQLDGIAVRFDRGDGTAVEFSTQELPEDERLAFAEALKSGDLVSAAQVVARHTGISPEQALSLLHAFRRND